jgi:hypothetical protein
MSATPVHLMILEMPQHVLPMSDWYAAYDVLQLITVVSQKVVLFLIIRNNEDGKVNPNVLFAKLHFSTVLDVHLLQIQVSCCYIYLSKSETLVKFVMLNNVHLYFEHSLL